MRRPLPTVLALAAVLAVCACDAPAMVAPDGNLYDASVADADEPRELPRSATFLITHLELARGPEEDGAVEGIDLDARASLGDAMAADCRDRHPDRQSPLGVPGVDNQLVVGLVPLILEFATLDLEHGFDAPIASGERLHAIRVTELDDLTSDADVQVEILVVERLRCFGGVCPPGEIPVGDLFVDRRMPIVRDLPGAIVEGRLRFELPTFAAAGPIGILLREVVVEVAIDEHGLEGVIAGGYAIEDVITFADSGALSIEPPDYTMLRMMLQGFSDLSPSPGDASVCDSISAAMSVDAVRVFVPMRT